MAQSDADDWQIRTCKQTINNASSKIAPRAQVTGLNYDDEILRIMWDDGHTSKYHHMWLCDHALWDNTTQQRMIDSGSIPLGIKPDSAEIVSCKLADGTDSQLLNIDWGRFNHPSASFDPVWLREHCYSDVTNKSDDSGSVCDQHDLWDNTFKPELFDYADIVNDDTGLRSAMHYLHRYGILLVSNTPANFDDTQKLAERIGFVRETLYGRMWSTRPDGSDTKAENDSAYSADFLRPHTDCTYLCDPPALQIFNCVSQSEHGGHSHYVDGFRVAEIIRERDPSAFDFLSTVALRHHCLDNDASLEAMGTIIELEHAAGARLSSSNKAHGIPLGIVKRIRFNDYDRSALTSLPFELVSEFYRAHRVLTEVIRDESSLLVHKLAPGTTAIINNMRVMHGRDAFRCVRSTDLPFSFH
jgi:trimethyllysine dioxygenase